MRRRNNEAKKGAINLSLCLGFRRQATGEDRCGLAPLPMQRPLEWFAAWEVTPVHTEPNCSRSGKKVCIKWKSCWMCCSYSHHSVRTEDSVACQCIHSFYNCDSQKRAETLIWKCLRCEQMHIYGLPLTNNYRVTVSICGTAERKEHLPITKRSLVLGLSLWS